MSHKRNEALRHVQHSMYHVIAAGEGSDRAPDSCKLCPYYRPDFKFRTCLYAHCPYKKQVNVFRSTPEKWDMSKEGKHISMDTLARICETLNCEITDVIELVPDEPASTGGKEHERIETKNNRKRN